MAKVKLEDLFEIEYDESDPDWYRIRAKPKFAKHHVRLETERAKIDFYHGGNQEDISIVPSRHEDFPKKFNSIYLEAYDKKPEQGYHGHGTIYISIKEVKTEAKK